MKGVAKIKGPKNPKIGVENFYEVTEFHKGTVVINPNAVKWKIFKKKDGQWVEAKGNSKIGKKVSFNFSPRSFGKELLVEAYMFDPELKAPPGLVVKPINGTRKILNTEILDLAGKKFEKPPKYGQSIQLKVTTENMLGETLKLSIWERDTLSDTGHDPTGNTQLWTGISKKIDNKGIASQKVMLSPSMLVLAKKGMFDGAEHEYYLLVEADKITTRSATTIVSSERVISEGNHQVAKPDVAPAAETSLIDSAIVAIQNAVGWDVPVVGGTTNAVVDVPDKIEGILAAYFAKEEFTKPTDEVTGQYVYKFARDNNNINKDNIAKIIKDRVDAAVKSDKKYAKLDIVKASLTETSYKKDATISFNIYKLGANFLKINSAPLEEEVYVVAVGLALEGKEVTIKIKEKEAILVASDADLPVLEAKENGAEITTLKATVEAGIAKVKIKLRPKADTDLATWKEKLVKGKKDGTYSYKFKNVTTITDTNKKQFATIILNNAKQGKQDNPKIADGKTAFADDVEKALATQTYNSGDTFTFDTYKPLAENLWLTAECQGDTKKHEGDFLKKDGEYFVVGKKCECEERIRAFMRMLRVGEGTEGDRGYTTIYSGEQFSDMTKHPEKVITAGAYSSSAAGAYQIMRYTWWWLGGEKLTDNNRKAGVYEEAHDYIKKYAIPDFTAESQDKLCIIIFKHKRAGSLELITQNKIKDSLETYGSYEWASLPPGRYGQPTQTMDIALTKYEKFLKEELAGTSDLKIKKGFLKEFDIKCSCKKSDLETNEFGLVQVTKLGNPYIINSGIEDSYSYTKKDGTASPVGQHGDDWMLPEKAQAFSESVYKLVKEYPNQKIYLGDCSAYNPAKNLGHSATGAHSNGNAFDCKFLKSDGSGSNDISNLTETEVKLSGRFIEVLKESGLFSTFYTDNGKIPGSVHSSGHADHIHGN